MTYNPLPTRVLVRRDPPKLKIGRLHLPPNFKDKGRVPQTGIVEAICPIARYANNAEAPSPAKVGDRILFKHGAGKEIDGDIQNCELLTVLWDDVLAIID